MVNIRQQTQFARSHKSVELAVFVVANTDIVSVTVNIGSVCRKRGKAVEFRACQNMAAYFVGFIAVSVPVSSDGEIGLWQIRREQTAAPVGVPCLFR